MFENDDNKSVVEKRLNDLEKYSDIPIDPTCIANKYILNRLIFSWLFKFWLYIIREILSGAVPLLIATKKIKTRRKQESVQKNEKNPLAFVSAFRQHIPHGSLPVQHKR